jgi:DNA-binding response OmpR family regulator
VKILIVESDLAVGERLFEALREDDYALDWVSSRAEAEQAMAGTDIDLVIVDLSMENGTKARMHLLCGLLTFDRNVPTIAITDDPNELEHVRDCADAAELAPVSVQRIREKTLDLLDRAAKEDKLIAAGNLTIDLRLRSVRTDSTIVELSPKEYSVLRVLAINAGDVVSRSELLDQAYGWGEEIESNALEVHISNLRKKLGKDRIQTARGVGYRLIA